MTSFSRAVFSLSHSDCVNSMDVVLVVIVEHLHAHTYMICDVGVGVKRVYCVGCV